MVSIALTALVTASTCLLIVWQVSALFFPQRVVNVTIPPGYPKHVPFYQLRCVEENGSIIPYGAVRFHVRKVFMQKEKITVKDIFTVNASSGWLALAVTLQNRWAVPGTIFALRVKASRNVYSNRPSTSQTIRVHINDSEALCHPRTKLCYFSSKAKFDLPESFPPGVSFGQLRPPSTSFLCPETQTEYQVENGEGLVNINSKQELYLTSPLDAERATKETFQVKCTIKDLKTSRLYSDTFSLHATIRILDVNDNAPYLPKDVSTNVHFHDTDLQQGRDLPIQFNVFDKDSEAVNDIVVRVEDDQLGLFKVRNTTVYDNIMASGGMLLISFVTAVKPIQFPGSEYNFSVVLEDRSLQTREENKVIYNVIIHKSLRNQLQQPVLPLNGEYSTMVSRQAARHARVIQPIKVPLFSRWFFSLSPGDQSIFGITPQTGIIYVKDDRELKDIPEQYIKINLSWINDVEKKGYVTVVVNLTTEDDPSNNKECDQLCASFEDEDHCTSSCGAGVQRGRCLWRRGITSTSFMSVEYATCTTNLETCPNGECDELEEFDKTLCPQDCIQQENVQGEAIAYEKGRGIQLAVGTCICIAYDSCYCERSEPPANKSRQKHPHILDQVHSTGDFTNIHTKATTGEPSFSTDKASKMEDSENHFITGITTVAPCGKGCTALICLLVTCGIGICVVFCVLRRVRQSTNRKQKHKYVGSRISLSVVPSDYVDERSSSVHESQSASDSSNTSKTMSDVKWEFPRENLILEETLGEGEFGRVMKAQAWNITRQQEYVTVAVKMLKGNGTHAEEMDLFSEFNMLKEVCHPNVIRLLGACTQKGGPLYIIVEYADLGSLRCFLRKTRRLEVSYTCQVGNPTYFVDGGDISRQQFRSIPWAELLSFAWQIANGMSYLSNMKLIHRDLATRNVLLASGKVVKISDFGLSRDVYEGETYLKRSKGRVPVKWMAIESLEDNLYTFKSDVWSFGVVLWEIATLGATPYPGVTPERLFQLLKAGYRMEKPNACSDELYSVMLMCWRENPHDRPSFKVLVTKLDQMLLQTMEYLELRTDEESLYWNENDRPPLITNSSEDEINGVAVEYGKIDVFQAQNETV
ncbi:proto-oncogene tyrosine-protein kinase receptor Ret-like [Limulus polyphemus]|uniref:Proto-oncogene tyrosine-protein kinase receptor Ret-like n=1 Tax=Limulus polyphemus TaxID=6850 RepID=A0ABM1S818_LIMPO|nr:proto-oncogene tyrosine-protein kinase receptor Ret-like [Limulus polyphemus]